MADEEVTATAKPAERKRTIFDLFQTDDSVETMGVLLRYSEDPPIRILVARAGGANKAFDTAIKNLTKSHRDAIKRGTLEPDVMTDILQEAYAKTVVKGWEGITERDGTEIECTPKNVKELFKRIPDMWTDVLSFASNFVNFLGSEEDTDAVIKN